MSSLTMSMTMNINSGTLSSMLFGATLALGGLLACDGPFSGDDGAEFTTDCRQVCEEYKDCYDTDFDADGCTDECVDESISNSGFQDKVDDCEECMDEETCLTGAFACASECNEVIDEST